MVSRFGFRLQGDGGGSLVLSVCVPSAISVVTLPEDYGNDGTLTGLTLDGNSAFINRTYR